MPNLSASDLERDVHPSAVRGYLAVVDRHVQFHDFPYAQIAKCLPRGFDRILPCPDSGHRGLLCGRNQLCGRRWHADFLSCTCLAWTAGDYSQCHQHRGNLARFTGQHMGIPLGIRTSCAKTEMALDLECDWRRDRCNSPSVDTRHAFRAAGPISHSLCHHPVRCRRSDSEQTSRTKRHQWHRNGIGTNSDFVRSNLWRLFRRGNELYDALFPQLSRNDRYSSEERTDESVFVVCERGRCDLVHLVRNGRLALFPSDGDGSGNWWLWRGRLGQTSRACCRPAVCDRCRPRGIVSSSRSTVLSKRQLGPATTFFR